MYKPKPQSQSDGIIISAWDLIGYIKYAVEKVANTIAVDCRLNYIVSGRFAFHCLKTETTAVVPPLFLSMREIVKRVLWTLLNPGPVILAKGFKSKFRHH
jgi:hypothetical protein